MRLRDLKKLIEENYEKMKFETQQANNGNFYIVDFQKGIDAINNLKEFKFLEGSVIELSQIEAIYLNRSIGDRVYVDADTYYEFVKVYNKITHKCEAVLDAIDESIPDQDKFSISVKLPDYKNLKNLSSFFKDLESALSQTVTNDIIGGEVKLQNFDSGSYWVEIIVGTGLALNLIAGLTWSAASIRNKVLEGDLMKEKLRSYVANNDALKALEKGLEDEINALVEVEAKRVLEKQNIENSDPEFVERIKRSIKIFAGLINEGMQIYNPIKSTEDVKNLFPDYSKLNVIAKIKNELAITSPEEVTEETNKQ